MKRALFIIFKKYRGILEGGGVANQRNLTMAQRVLGEGNVDVIYLHDESQRRSVWNLMASAVCYPFGYWNGLTPNRVREMVDRAMEYDNLFLSTSLFGIIAKELKRRQYRGRIIVNFHNVESLYYEAALSKRLPIRDIVIGCAKKNDGFSCQYADTVVALNRRDSEMLRKMYGRGADVLAPIALEDKCKTVQFDKKTMTSKRPLCLFLGSYFPANRDGIVWFVENVLPHVDVKLQVVGKGMARLKEEECMRGIDIESDVPDLATYYLSADFMILPIFSGSGMKVKTCESLMYGKNILGTDEAFEGYDIDAERVGGRCNTAEDFIRSIRKYAEHPVTRFNAYAREVYEEKYSEEATLDVFNGVFS